MEQAVVQHLEWSADVRRQTCATPCTDPRHYVCPHRSTVRDGFPLGGPPEPHHLAVRGPAGAREFFCAHCGRTAKDLRDSIAGAS